MLFRSGAVLGEIAQFLTQDYSPTQADYIHATTGYTAVSYTHLDVYKRQI